MHIVTTNRAYDKGKTKPAHLYSASYMTLISEELMYGTC